MKHTRTVYWKCLHGLKPQKEESSDQTDNAVVTETSACPLRKYERNFRGVHGKILNAN